MANNRLYIVDSETLEYIIIAKGGVDSWSLGNVDVLCKFLSGVADYNADKSKLVLGTENDSDFFDKYIKNGTNVNKIGGWKYHEPNE